MRGMYQDKIGGEELKSPDMRTFRSVDEVLDFAINREIEAQDFYLKLAGFVETPEMVKMLLDLVSKELEHRAKLEAVKAGEIGIDEEKVGDLAQRISDNHR